MYFPKITEASFTLQLGEDSGAFPGQWARNLMQNLSRSGAVSGDAHFWVLPLNCVPPVLHVSFQGPLCLRLSQGVSSLVQGPSLRLSGWHLPHQVRIFGGQWLEGPSQPRSVAPKC